MSIYMIFNDLNEKPTLENLTLAYGATTVEGGRQEAENRGFVDILDVFEAHDDTEADCILHEVTSNPEYG